MKVDATHISELATSSVQVQQHADPKQGVAAKNKVDNTQAANIASISAEKASKIKKEEANAQSVDLKNVAQQLQDFVGSFNTSLQFSVDEDSGRDVIKVLEKETGDVVRQFPSEEILDVIKSLSNATGILFDETA